MCGNLHIRNKLPILIASLLLTDLAIFVDIPVVRQVLAFTFYTFIPGLLIIYILKLNTLSLLKKLLVSIGLSISFLIATSLILNFLLQYLGNGRPLSTVPLTIALSFFVGFLCVFGYWANPTAFSFARVKEDKVASIVRPSFVISLLLPALAVLGTVIMNTTGDNRISLFILVLIPILICTIVFLRKHITQSSCVIVIYAVGVSILLMYGLRSNYVMGYDVHTEFYAFQLTWKQARWNIASYPNLLNATLSTSLLPAVYQSLMNLPAPQYVYKVAYQLIFALTPLIVYVISRKHLSQTGSFLAAVFFMIFPDFVTLQSAVRQEIALFLFALALMVSFESDIPLLAKKICFITFMFTVVLSHYTVAYVFFILFCLAWLTTRIRRAWRSPQSLVNISIVAMLAVTIYVWYGLLTPVAFSEHAQMFFNQTVYNIANFFKEEQAFSRLSTLSTEQLPQTLVRAKSLVYNIAMGFVFIGVCAMFAKAKKWEPERLIITAIAFITPASMVFLPVTYQYDIGRMLQQMLLFLAPCFVIGCDFVSEHLFHRYRPWLPVVVVISQFMFAVMLINQVLSIPTSLVLNNSGREFDKIYITDDELAGTRWLANYRASDKIIYGDYYADVRFTEGLGKPVARGIGWMSWIDLESLPWGDSYIYLRRANVVNERLYIGYTDSVQVSQKDYTDLFLGRDKVYDNGSAQVYEFLEYKPKLTE